MTYRRNIDVTWILVGACSLLFLIGTALAGVAGGKSTNPQAMYALLIGGLIHNWGILLSEPWRLVTAMFLHYDILHLALNMFSLVSLGRVISKYFGNKVVFSIFVFTGIFGNLISVLTNDGSLSLGASGAVFGLVGFVLVHSVISHHFPYRFYNVLPAVIYSLIFGFLPGTNINNWAHLGGLAAGIALGYAYNTKLGRKIITDWVWIAVVLVVAAWLAALINFGINLTMA